MYRIGKPEADAAARVIQSGSLFRIDSRFHEVESFEKEFCEKIGAAHCLCLSSGTGALTAALVAVGAGPGDEVIIPGYTFIATAAAVLSVGAIPVLADIDETMTLDMDDVERKLSPHTKAVIPVHIQGFPSNMDRLLALREAHGFYIIEDACQSDGGGYRGRRLGTIGDCGAFSFNFFKLLSAGEGGALVTGNRTFFERALIYHDCGSNFWCYDQPVTEPSFSGTNMRVSEITGAILREQLKRLDGILGDLRRAKARHREALAGLPGIRFSPSNDAEGDCGIMLPLIFDDEAAAMRFEAAAADWYAGRPINTGKHVFSAWTPVLEKRGAHVVGINPYFNPKNKGLNMDVDDASCRRTLDILRRTVYIPMPCEEDAGRLDDSADALREAVRRM